MLVGGLSCFHADNGFRGWRAILRFTVPYLLSYFSSRIAISGRVLAVALLHLPADVNGGFTQSAHCRVTRSIDGLGLVL